MGTTVGFPRREWRTDRPDEFGCPTGELKREGEELVFRPAVLRRSIGGSPLDLLRLARQTRRAARRYLNDHGLKRPHLPWHRIETARRAEERIRKA